MADVVGNVFGAVDTNGDAMVVFAHRDQWGTHVIVLPVPSARELARLLGQQADAAEALQRLLASQAVAAKTGGDKPS